jgi:hypothetical protein
MHADICPPEDAAAVERLKEALRSLGGELLDRHNSALGVDMWVFRVGEERVTIFADALSVDIEGPGELVHQILTAMCEGST